MSFFKSLLKDLIEEGHTIDIAANISESDVPACYREWGCKVYPLSCTRSPLDKRNFRAVKEIRHIVTEEKYDLVHCHTPIAAMCTRLACRKLRKSGLKVFYTAHGFHFYKGAPLKNWLLYYPVEWVCAYWTDVLITINKEDYARAQKHMHAKRVEYVPGVGIDLQKFVPNRLSQEGKDCLRESIGVGKEDKLLLSVGELNANKNHAVVIRAIAELQNPSIHYAIAGTGELHDELLNLAAELGVADRVHLLGYRSDVPDLYQAADLYIHPSKREGLPVALMEAVASKTPVICSDIRGNTDLVGQQEWFDCTDTDGIAKKIRESFQNNHTGETERNYRNLKKYDLTAVISDMETLYSHGGGVKHLYEIYKQQFLRKSIGIPADASFLLSVGELNANKNHAVVIRAIAELQNPSIHYAIAGTGELHDELLNLAAELGVADRVHLLGYRSDVPDLYQAADICVFPSIREGLGLAAIEGMASGLPLVCADNRGTRDYAINGENAIVCKFDDIQQFARALTIMLTDTELSIRMGNLNKERAKRYDVNSVIVQMKDIYRKLLDMYSVQ